MNHTVGDVARLTGITVRTLHHYHEIGLVVPGRSAAGHRVYGSDHLESLQQVLFFRELGFPLTEIATIMQDPHFDRRAALMQQRSLLQGKAVRLQRMIDAVDLALLAHDEGMTMEPEDLFDGFRPHEYEAEAKERWGNTKSYRESQRRTARYGKKEWTAARAEGEDIARRFGDLLRTGTAPDSRRAAALAEEHRLHIERWFYACTREMHVNLGEMYAADSRFSAYWDGFESGLAAFVRDAIIANAG
jgi:DNA-binding transcriptional MerR regulator